MLNLRAAHEPPQQASNRDHRGHDRDDHPRTGNVLLRALNPLPAGLRPARGPQRLGNPASDRPHDLHERPHGRDRHDARADEANIALEDGGQCVGEILGPVKRAIGVERKQDAVGHEHADEHRDANGHANQVPHADQGQRQRRRNHRPRRTNPERRAHLRGGDLEVAEQRHRRRCDCAPRDRHQTALVVLARILRIPDLEDLGAGHTLGIGQIRAGHEGATQRNRIHDAQRATDRTHEHRLPVGEAVPPAHNYQSRQDEDNRGEGSRRRRDRLDDVVLLNGVITPETQNRHRDDGGRDGGRERQADLQAQVHVRRREYQRDNATNNDAAQGEFFE